MNINYLTYQPNIYSSNSRKASPPSFCGRLIPEALTHVNIGSKPDGFIGKIQVRLADGKDAILNVFKKKTNTNSENYKIINDYNELIGEMDITIKKILNYKIYDSRATDPSHVFVDMVKNYTRPGTPDHNPKIIHHKDIGTRLLQIAQRRSDETLCNGELKLIAKDVVLKDWYIDVLGMKQEFPPTPSSFRINIHNPNQLYLPPEAKEPLSKLRGGL